MGERDLSREELEELDSGSVIRYTNDLSEVCYFIVEGVKEGKIYGQMASPIGVNAIELDELAKRGPRLGRFD
mgnify:CR=1 FL=1|jgi:hypothetical protein|tara:strand:- start:709 stop:924 length:216 start_codon:yes stop_codon:yes gene_type:complete